MGPRRQCRPGQIKERATNPEKKSEQDQKGRLPTYSTMRWSRGHFRSMFGPTVMVESPGFGLLVQHRTVIMPLASGKL